MKIMDPKVKARFYKLQNRLNNAYYESREIDDTDNPEDVKDLVLVMVATILERPEATDKEILQEAFAPFN